MNRVLEAFRNCISEPKCKDCPWKECEELGNRKIEIPADLALAVERMLVELILYKEDKEEILDP